MTLSRFRSWRCLIAKLALIGALAFIGASPQSAAARCESRDSLESQWKVIYSIPGTTVFKPARQDRSHPEAVAHVRWRILPRELYETIWHYGRFPEFIPHVRESRVLESADHRVWVYQRLSLPGPIRDRHYVMESTDRGSNPGRDTYFVQWWLSDRSPPQVSNTIVEPKSFRGCWDIRPDGINGLDALYWIELDPGGWIPRWVVQGSMRHYLVNLMKAIRRQLETAAGAKP